MASVSRALDRIKDDLNPFVSDEQIRQACRDAGHLWRERLLGPVATLHLFILQVLQQNTAIRALRHLAGSALNPAAYCRARMRLPVEVFRTLLHASADAINRTHGSIGAAALWLGHRVLLLDASSSIAPDVPALQKAFKQPRNQKPGCGFPVPKILGMIDAFTGVMLEMLVFPLYTHEAAQTWRLHPRMKPGDLVVADRGFCSFVNLAFLQAAGVLALLRLHQKQIVDFRPHRKHNPGGKKARKGKPTSRWVRRLGRHDQIVDWVKPKKRPQWVLPAQYAELPETLRVRELRYTLACKGQRTRQITIVTTLLDAERYPKEKIAELYGVRWSVETHFGELKTTMKMRKIKCRTPAGVEKELIVYGLVYNLVRAVMLAAAQRQAVEVARISFIDAMRWLQSAEAGETVPELVVNTSRPERHEPRVIKDLNDTYLKMTKPRRQLRQALKRGEVVSRKAK
jgi:hypothetical protein